jgi:hypothetical protein
MKDDLIWHNFFFVRMSFCLMCNKYSFMPWFIIIWEEDCHTDLTDDLKTFKFKCFRLIHCVIMYCSRNMFYWYILRVSPGCTSSVTLLFSPLCVVVSVVMVGYVPIKKKSLYLHSYINNIYFYCIIFFDMIYVRPLWL